MIRKKNECPVAVNKNFKGGAGEFVVTHLATAEELEQAGRLYGCGRLEPGHSVGWHVHEGDAEICFFLRGSGTVKDADGMEYPVTAGDVHICPQGQGHAIYNSGTGPLVYTALVYYPNGRT